MLASEVLMEQTVALLRSQLERVKLPASSIRVMIDERAPPMSGAEFIGVYGATAVNENPPAHVTRKIVYGLTIGVTHRCEGAANEHTGENVLTESEIARVRPSMLRRADEIIEVMLDADGWTLISAVNSVLASEGGCFGQFIVPLGLMAVDSAPVVKYADHWDVQEEEQSQRYAGLHLEIEFGGAEFYRPTSP